MSDAGSGATFGAAFSDWVEACWLGEGDVASRSLDAIVSLPAEVLVVQATTVFARLVEAFAPGVAEEEMAAALVQHLVIEAPDPARQALIRDVVTMASPRSSPARRLEA